MTPGHKYTACINNIFQNQPPHHLTADLRLDSCEMGKDQTYIARLCPHTPCHKSVEGRENEYSERTAGEAEQCERISNTCCRWFENPLTSFIGVHFLLRSCEYVTDGESSFKAERSWRQTATEYRAWFCSTLSISLPPRDNCAYWWLIYIWFTFSFHRAFGWSQFCPGKRALHLSPNSRQLTVILHVGFSGDWRSKWMLSASNQVLSLLRAASVTETQRRKHSVLQKFGLLPHLVYFFLPWGCKLPWLISNMGN